MVLSVLVALIADAGAVRDDPEAGRNGRTTSRRGFFGWFNRGFDRGSARLPARRRAACSARRGRFMVVYRR